MIHMCDIINQAADAANEGHFHVDSRLGWQDWVREHFQHTQDAILTALTSPWGRIIP